MLRHYRPDAGPERGRDARFATGRPPADREPLLQLRRRDLLDADAGEARLGEPGPQRLGPIDVVAPDADHEPLRERTAVWWFATALARLEGQQNLRKWAFGVGEDAQRVA